MAYTKYDVYRATGLPTCMQRLLIDIALMNILDNIDLPIVGPVGADSPEGRPAATAMRHMVQVQDEQAFGEGVRAL